MQILAPLTDFAECARVLDDRLLSRQVADCGKIMSTLSVLGVHESGLTLSPVDTQHPAVLMWRGYESALAVYSTFVYNECRLRGFPRLQVAPYSHRTFALSAGWPDRTLSPDGRDAELPPWWGDDRVHKSHRNALVYIDRQHYGALNWGGIPILDFYWPVTGDYVPEPVHPGSQYASIVERRKRSVTVS